MKRVSAEGPVIVALGGRLEVTVGAGAVADDGAELVGHHHAIDGLVVGGASSEGVGRPVGPGDVEAVSPLVAEVAAAVGDDVQCDAVAGGEACPPGCWEIAGSLVLRMR